MLCISITHGRCKLSAPLREHGNLPRCKLEKRFDRQSCVKFSYFFHLIRDFNSDGNSMDVISFVFVIKKMFLIFVIADNYMKLKIGHLKLDHSIK